MERSARKPKKSDIKLRKEKNGLILNFHNTTINNGKVLRIRLINACFDYSNTKLVTIDHRGNIFVIDLISKKIWKTFDKCNRSTTIQNNPYSLNQYFIGTRDGEIVLVDTEKGHIKNSEKFCSLPIDTISIPINFDNVTALSANLLIHFLIATSTEAILVDLKTFQANYKLEFNSNICYKQTSLKFVSYFPNSERIFACFSNDSVHIWSTTFVNNSKNTENSKNDNILNKSNTKVDESTDIEFDEQQTQEKATSKLKFNLKTIRILYPLKNRDKQLKLNKCSDNNELKFSDKIDYDNQSIETTDGTLKFLNITTTDSDIKDFSKGLIDSFEFSLDGNYMCLTTLDGYIVLLSTITLEIVKIIKTHDVPLKKCYCFEKNVYKISNEIPSIRKSNTVQSPTDLLIIALTSQSDIILVDCNDLLVKTIILGGGITYKMNLSYNGELLYGILKTGEIKVFQTSAALNVLLTTQKNIDIVNKIGKSVTTSEKVILTNELKKTLSKDRLLPILKEYGSYSNTYRHLIWTTLLDVPSNKAHFTELLKKGLHPIVLKYDDEFPIKDATLLRNLKKISSCLIYWSRILAECDYLPKFIFPFLKIFPNSSILTFELLLTILYNHCQLWFEFAPMEPLNYLGLIENLLYHFDIELHKFYQNRNITTKQYAWSILTTNFSEIFDEQQWYQLWDNILTKDIDYIIFIILAYQIQQRNIIMRLETNESIESFFHEQYIIDMRKLLKKANELQKICPIDLQPKRYLKSFVYIPKGFYPKFENYPKEWIELKDKEMEAINIENNILDEKIRNLEIEEIQLAKKLEEGLKDEEIQIRLKELEKLYCGAISREEERIACQRKMVLMYQKETRNRRSKVLEMVRESMNRKNINLHENQLDTLMRDIERTRLRDETDMMLADEDIKDRDLNLLSQIYKIKSNSVVSNNINRKSNNSHTNTNNNNNNAINENVKYHEDITRNKKKYQNDDYNDDDYDDNNMNAIFMNQNYINETVQFKSRSKDNNSRTSISETANKYTTRLAKEFQKRNNVILKTYGVQLNPNSNPRVILDDKKRTTILSNPNKNNNNSNNNNDKRKNKNYFDSIEEILDQIQIEYENILDNPES